LQSLLSVVRGFPKRADDTWDIFGATRTPDDQTARVRNLSHVFFSLLDHGHMSSTAMTRTVLISSGLFAVAFALSFLLPKDARLEEF
jgi:hypothetical protein